MKAGPAHPAVSFRDILCISLGTTEIFDELEVIRTAPSSAVYQRDLAQNEGSRQKFHGNKTALHFTSITVNPSTTSHCFMKPSRQNESHSGKCHRCQHCQDPLQVKAWHFSPRFHGEDEERVPNSPPHPIDGPFDHSRPSAWRLNPGDRGLTSLEKMNQSLSWLMPRMRRL